MQYQEHPMEELMPLIHKTLSGGGEFRLYPKGKSMLPLIRPGKDSVVLSTPDKISKHDICLYQRKNGQFILHRVMKTADDGTLTFCGDNQWVMEKGIPSDAVIAVVKAIYRKDKIIGITDILYRLYVRIHCFIPWRKLLFLPRRIKQKIFKKAL